MDCTVPHGKIWMKTEHIYIYYYWHIYNNVYKIIRIILLRNQIITEFTSYATLNLFEFGPGNEKKIKKSYV